MKILVTGGSGFLGQRVIKRLVLDGHSITALARSESSKKVVEARGATAVIGDITAVDGFSRSLSAFDVIVHAAAPVEFWGPWEKFQNGIIDSTMSLAKACAEQGVKRFIHISSESVLQDREGLVDIDESQPYPEEPNSYYGKAKKIAEQQLLHLNSKMEIVILRPTFIWGDGCPAFETLSQKVRSGQFMWMNQGKHPFEAVHVDNVAEAIRLALSKGQNNGIYFVTDDETATTREFFENLFRSLKLPIPKMSVPSSLVGPAACIIEFIWKTLNLKSTPPITRFDLAFVAQPRKYNINRIKKELGYKPVIKRKNVFN